MHRILPTALAAVLLAVAPVLADAPDYAATEPLFDGSTNVIGEKIVYPDSGPARVTSLIVTVPPGESTGPHRHGAPAFGYVLEGQVTVDYGAHGRRTYRRGEAFMEAEAVTHEGVNDGDVPVRILVVFMGAEGTENVIRER